VAPWRLWQEVHAWGGADEVSNLKLWKAVGGGFNPPGSLTMLSTACKNAYTNCLSQFDAVRGWRSLWGAVVLGGRR